MQRKRYWLTPPDLYQKLDNEFHFDFDPCPYPLPEGYNSLNEPWGKCNYVNPPYRTIDAVDGKATTAFVRKAIAEQQQGKTSVLLIPCQGYVNLLLQAGAELRPYGRVKWLECESKEPWASPVNITGFVLRGK